MNKQNEQDFSLKSTSLFFAYAKAKGEKTFKLFGLLDGCTYFKKCRCPRYKIEEIENLKKLANEWVELNKDTDLHIKFVSMNNKILFVK